MGLLRKALVVGGVLYMLPSPPAETPNADDPSTLETIQAAGQTLADAKGFCAREPQACAVGQFIATKTAGKAKYAIQLAYDWAHPTPAAPASVTAKGAPPLRLNTIVDNKPAKIADLLKGSQN